MRSRSGHLGPAVLVAGIGNLFLGDDGFGVEVVHRLRRRALPDGVDVVDYGIRGVHLAYDLLEERYTTLILVDALPRGEPPGTLTVVEADPATVGDEGPVDAHSMSPGVVLAALHRLGGRPPRVLVVGCQPAALEEGMRLSAPVADAVEDAVRVVAGLAVAELDRVPAPAGGGTAAAHTGEGS